MTNRPFFPFAFALALLTGWLSVASADEQSERYARAIQREVEYARRAAQRIVKPGDSERERWVKRLDEVYTGRVPEDPARWFELVVVGNTNLWTRDGSKFFAELHEQVCERLELKDDEAITRVQYLAYARAFLGPDSPPWRILDLDREARRPFRSFDTDRDGVLTTWECPTDLQNRFGTYDRNGDGRLDPAEYGEYFRTQVIDQVKAAEPPKDQSEADRRKLMSLSDDERKEEVERRLTRPVIYRDPTLLPKGILAWFREFDEDEDLQIALYEWRETGRPLAEFRAMDLNDDGLLELSEYQRYVRWQAEDGDFAEDDLSEGDARKLPPTSSGRTGSRGPDR